MKLLLPILIGISSLTIHAQTFHDLIQKANSFYKSGAYLESGKTYDAAFKIKEGTASEYYNAACSWALSGDTIESIQYLNLSVDNGNTNKKWMLQDKDLKTLHTVKSWEVVLTKVKANLDEYEKDFDKPLKEQLEKIHVKDQTLRQLSGEVKEKFGRESEEMEYFHELISEQDHLNQVEVVKIIEERGWVGRSLVGKRANVALWLVIQHAPLEMQEKYLPLLRTSVKKGESKGSQLALMEDRVSLRNGKQQIYGSQIYGNDDGSYYVKDLKDPEYVNQRRKEVGLGPIQDYVKKWNIEWTIEQKEK